jgi:hypothetical protein
MHLLFPTGKNHFLHALVFFKLSSLWRDATTLCIQGIFGTLSVNDTHLYSNAIMLSVVKLCPFLFIVILDVNTLSVARLFHAPVAQW